jgi:hypothetical protein
MGEYVRLLEMIVNNPYARIRDFSLFRTQELIVRGNTPIKDVQFEKIEESDKNITIVKRFEKQADKYGDTIAIKTRKSSISYKKLN